MMNFNIRRWGVALAIFLLPFTFYAESNQSKANESSQMDALRCAHADNATLSVSIELQVIRCEVDKDTHTLKILVDTNSRTAFAVCDMIARHLKSANLSDGKSIEIFSPFSGDSPIATCKN